MMASKTWLAVLLSVAVWFVYVKWFAPPMEGPKPTDTTVQEAQKVATPKPFVPTKAQVAVEHSIRNNLLVASFGKDGLLQNEIKKYRAPDKGFLRILESPTVAGQLSFSDETFNQSYRAANQLKTQSDRTVSYDALVQKVRIQQEFLLQEDFFILWKIVIQSAEARDLGYLMVPVGSKPLPSDSNEPLKSWEVTYYQNGSLHRQSPDSLETGDKVLQGATLWTAYGNRYFSNVVINDGKLNPDLVLSKSDHFAGGVLRFPIRFSKNQSETVIPLKIFSGPKEHSELVKVEGLKGLIDYGMFTFVAYPLLYFLKALYGIVRNYGLAIIFLTIVVRILFYPLSVKSFRSMKEMQKLQPQIALLKERYGEDKERLSREQMALFKTHKVNPAGGCLPLLVQFPVFIALYAVLGNSVDLFQAPFFGWIHDLSSKDPYYIYPILMGIAMLLQQKMMPTPGMDPTQAKIMYIMPIVFTFLMVNLPSGLTLYIFVSTLLGIAQQLAMNRIFGNSKVALLQP